MKLHKLHTIFLLSTLSYTSAVALPWKAMIHSPHRRRDQHDPSQQIRSPKPATETIPSAASETPTAVTMPSKSALEASSSMFLLSSDSTQPLSAINPTTIPISSPIQTTVATPTAILPSLALTLLTIPSSSLLATPSGDPISASTQAPSSSSPSSSNRSWVLLGIFFLAFGLLGLVVFVLTRTRRRSAPKKRERKVKKRAELPPTTVGKVGVGPEDEIERGDDVKARMGRGEGWVGAKRCKKGEGNREKYKEGGERPKKGGEKENGWSLQSPGYRR